MDKNEKEPLSLVSAMEQVSGLTNQVAMICGSYFVELVKNGTPYNLACEMVKEWHSMYWSKQFWPDDDGNSYE